MFTTKPFLEKLTALFARMDEAYDKAATASGFECRGCADNCCHTRFYHHTLVEFLYLKEGLDRLPQADRLLADQRAAEADRLMKDLERSGQPVRVLCPLNDQERCILYPFRPMICRLHGIPHQLRRPDGQRQLGPGCGDFDRQCVGREQVVLDRTPLYIALANLEKELRGQAKFEGRIRMTIAEMIVTDLFTR